MSQENVDRMRAALEAWNNGDLDGYLAVADPALIFHTSGVFLPHDPVYRGHDGFHAFWKTFHDAWEQLDIDIARMDDLDNRVLALLSFDAVGRTSGVRVQRKIANVATFADGFIVELRAYRDWQQALKAVGVTE
jgi:ketosteroid isomerase-like protein